MIAGCEGQVDELFCDGYLPLPHLIERRLKLMGKRGDSLELAGGARALDRVHGAEHPPDLLHVAGVMLQFEQSRFKLG